MISRKRLSVATCCTLFTPTRTGSFGRRPCSQESTATHFSEYLVPAHLGFFVYAAARGDFVLGGLQAVFESNLDTLLDAVVDAEHRCPLDPGCSRGSGACSACVHLGEPSCRYFNRFLNRTVLFGPKGYLRAPAAPADH